MEVVQELCISLESSEGDVIQVWIPIGYVTINDDETVPLTRETVFHDQRWSNTSAAMVAHYQSLLDEHMVDLNRVNCVEKCVNVMTAMKA